MTIRFDDPVRQEVWETIRALNDAWTRGNPDDLSLYFHPRMVAITATDQERLTGGAACIAGWKGFCDAATIHHWEEREPTIEIFGDAAVVTYYYDMSFTMGGRTIALAGRDMFTLVREGGRWLAVADQFSPFPS
ncbi:MAG: nuclear transport factor 2 family protein [Nitrospinae bacterium]|nr:nuclear transport factor 2 family protein [Nitrospinota bacterium]